MFDIITINLNINSGIFLSAPESNNETRSLNELRNLEYPGKRIFLQYKQTDLQFYYSD